jgi:deoxyribose-phosphate aldolase
MTKTEELAKMIDHSILHPEYTDKDLVNQCAVARRYNVASVCVKPYAVKQAVELLKGSGVLVGCVVGFPHGNSSTAVKVFEAEEACNYGATEIDMVINIGKALGEDWNYVEQEIKAVTMTCHNNNAIVKIIFETDYVTRDGKINPISSCNFFNFILWNFFQPSHVRSTS